MKKINKDNQQVKADLVKAMLSHVPFDGWTWKAMEQGAVDINFEKNITEKQRIKIYKLHFNNGGIDFIKLFVEIVDKAVEKDFISLDKKPERIPEKIKKLILMRLNYCIPYKESIRSSLSLMAFPKNSKKSMKILYNTCNSIWRLAGDKSTDFSFYTKRFSLAGVYTSTLLYWLDDVSLNQLETERFLDRRLQDISMISKIKNPFNFIKNISNNVNPLRDNMGINLLSKVIKSITKIKKTNFSKNF